MTHPVCRGRVVEREPIMRVPHPFLLIALLVAGCSGREATSDVALASDRATNPVQVLPIMDIALEAHPEIEARGIFDAALSGTGTLALAGKSGVWILDTLGSVLHQSGRSGDGPGEFRGAVWVEQCEPGKFFVWDVLRSKVVVLDTKGALVREFQVPAVTQRMSCDGFHTIAVMMPSRVPNGPPKPGESLWARIDLINTMGDSIGSIGEVPAGENRTLGRQTSFAVGNGRVLFGTAETGTVVSRDVEGKNQLLHHLPDSPRVPSQQQFEAAIDRLMAAVGTSPADDQIRESLRSTGLPAQLPAFRSLHLAPDSILWAVTSAYGDGLTSLSGVHLATGRVESLMLGEEIDVFQVGRDMLLGRIGSERRAPRLVLYKLVRPK